MTGVTEIMLVGGLCVQVEGDAEFVESLILAAARGSIMELAWLTEVGRGDRIGINPEHVLMLRASSAGRETGRGL